MDTFFLVIAFILCLALLIPFYRVYKGPTVFDRLLGAAAVGTKTITLILLFGIMYEYLDMFIDISLGYAILNFIGVIAMAKYFRSKERASK
ncbi:MAG TPA: pH regulation protein F [Desulfonatronum sp.]|nr:pH regulation protein F [Desulfonatronum sp.]